ncbi:glycosyltransferase family 2 protein [Paenibacillus sp. NPDC056579]|uniref:glycosyltransferase family 2 protein n=1 Tax=Paenibacillus sp. NPDC056579 TaxID=3345871 RepID=UPI0036C6A11D
MKQCASVIVTYNPTNVVVELIYQLLSQGAYVIIIDNGSKESREIHEIKKANHQKLLFCQFDQNVGLALAQNKGIEIAQKLCVDYISFFDQDSECPQNYIESMMKCFSDEKYLNYKIGILAPNYYDKNTNQFARFAKLESTTYRHIECVGASKEPVDVSFVISSGSMMPVSLFKEIGLFVDNFFIDQVDTEYCLRAISNGYKVLVNPDCIIIHTIGNRTKETLLGVVIKPNHHSEMRKYFIVRNGMKTVFWYGMRFPGFTVLMLSRLGHDFLGVLFFEEKKIRKIFYMFKGLCHSFLSIKSWNRLEKKGISNHL